MISIILLITTYATYSRKQEKLQLMTFKIAQTKTTPSAEFKNGHIMVTGKLFPFETPEIFDIFQDRLRTYFKNPEKHTCIEFHFSIVNAISKRYLINTFNLLEQMYKRGSDMEVNWFYQSDNEDIREFGEICKSNFKINFNMKKAD